jgi:hypothetical protein
MEVKMGQFLTTLIMIVLLLLVFLIWQLTKRKQIPVIECSTPLPPEACDPNWLDGVTYTPLWKLPERNCDGRLLAGGQCTARTYTDVNGQDFAIQIEGADAIAVQDYLNTAKAHFLVQQVRRGVRLSPTQDLPSLAAILVDTAVEWSGLSESQLAQLRDELAEKYRVEGPSVTLALVLSNVKNEAPPDPERVLSAAIARAVGEYRRPDIIANVPQAEIDRIIADIPKTMTALMREPGATFLVDTARLPVGDERYRDLLDSDSSALLISLEWASAPQKRKSEDLWVVWFSIDPSIGRNEPRAYKEKCRVSSASAGITATGGSMTMSFSRISPNPATWPLAAVDKNGDAYEKRSSPTAGTYDVVVTGGPEGGTYTMSGGWVQGSGCDRS